MTCVQATSEVSDFIPDSGIDSICDTQEFRRNWLVPTVSGKNEILTRPTDFCIPDPNLTWRPYCSQLYQLDELIFVAYYQSS